MKNNKHPRDLTPDEIINSLMSDMKGLLEVEEMRDIAEPIIKRYKDNMPLFSAFIGSMVVSYFEGDYPKARAFLEDLFKESYTIEVKDKELQKYLDMLDKELDDEKEE